MSHHIFDSEDGSSRF